MNDKVVKFPSTLQPGRWYHCWLRHLWGRWSDPEPFDWTVIGPPVHQYEAPGQERFCQVCNKREVRHA